MTLQEQIEKINKIRLEMWPESANLNTVELDHLLATLLEEVGEFRQAIRSFLGRKFSPEKISERHHVVEEFGDILVPIIALSNQTGITFEEALKASIDKLSKRKQKNSDEKRLNHIAKYDAMQHQPFRYDLEDPINWCYVCNKNTSTTAITCI